MMSQPKKHITDTRPYAQFTSYPAPPMQVRKRTMLWWVALGSAILVSGPARSLVVNVRFVLWCRLVLGRC
jgi:hypothetical protein